MEAAIAGNWQIQLQTQPAQSSDTNTLDLAFFRALQSAQWDYGFAIDIDGLIMQVSRAYDKFCPRKIDFGFLMLQSCLDEILVSNGNNTYKTPHMGKETLLQAGVLPVSVGVSAHAINVARQVMVGLDNNDSLDNDDKCKNGDE
jgi:hypothetical protein